MANVELNQLSKFAWEIPPSGKMRVPARVYASEALLDKIRGDLTLKQLVHATQLPGIHKFALALPDAHQGYGFPVGGVAALDAEHGAISPGAIGFDINCGVRLCRTNLSVDELRGKEHDLVEALFRTIPTGIGKGTAVGELANDEIEDVAREGVRWAVRNGYGVDDDLAHCEDEGVRPGADPRAISQDAKDRGRVQLGSLGSGNHFLEIQRVADVLDDATAGAYGLMTDQIVVLIHCGSRGFGHQVCTDYLKRVEREHRDVIDQLPDRELACAPAGSEAALDYYSAMNCAINYAWANRQAIMHQVRQAFGRVFREDWRDLGMELLYDVAHNIGKKEVHRVNGHEREVYVHRKGATRAFPPGRPELPDAYRDVGQPVLIPGSMGTSSYVLMGNANSLDLSFGSTAHGAGRLMSRSQAKKRWRAEQLTDDLLAQGIVVRGRSKRTISEEAPGAYKNADEVVEVSHQVGVARKVARLMPVCNIKG